MGEIWIIGITLFTAMTFLVWKLFNGYYKKKNDFKDAKELGF